MRKIKIAALVLALCLLVSSLGACSAVDVSEVMTVNGAKVTGGEYRFYLGVMKEMIAVELSKNSADEVDWENDEVESKKAIEVAKQRAYDDIVKIKVAAAEAKSRGLVVSSDEKSSVSSSILSYFGTADKEQVLKDCELSDEAFSSMVEDLALSQKLQEDIATENEASLSEISADEVRAKYDSLLEQYAASGIITAKHILINFTKDDGTTRTEEEALAEAERIKAMITDDNFDELMAQYSEDPGSQTNPDGYTFTHNDGSMVQEFDDGAYALAEGQISEPVKTSYGYHIIKRVSSLPDFEDEATQQELKNIIVSERVSALYDELVQGLVDSANVAKNESRYEKIK